MYEPYEPPPPTVPPPEAYAHPVGATPPEAAAPLLPTGAAPPSAIGPLLAVLGLGMALVGIFALPTQRYGPGPDRDVGFVQLHDLVTESDELATFPDAASSLAQFWWTSGLLLSAAALTVLTGALCVAHDPRALRPLGFVLAFTALVTGALHALAMSQTADYASVANLAPSQSLFHDAGPGPWLGFAGLGAIEAGGVLAVVLAHWRRRT